MIFSRIPFPTVVFPFSFSPIRQKRETKEKIKEKNILSGPRLGSLLLYPPNILRRGLELRFRLPLVSLPVVAAAEGASSGIRGAAVPCTLRGVEGGLHPKPSASGPSRWCSPIKVWVCRNWS